MGVLKGIEEIDWGQWEHAYGPATDVPALLQELLEEESAEDAQYELYGNIIHQGTVYPATKHAIPWLIKLLVPFHSDSEQLTPAPHHDHFASLLDDALASSASRGFDLVASYSPSTSHNHCGRVLAPESTADRVWLLQYLLDLAWGNSYMRQHAHLDDDGSPEYATRMAEEVSHVDGARAAVVDGFEVYLALFDSEDVSEVGAAIDLIVGVPELLERLQKDAWAKFEALLAHSDARVRTKATMGLGWFQSWKGMSEYIDRASTDESEAVRWAAAWASGYHRLHTQEVVDRLVHAMFEPRALDDELEAVLERSVGQASIAPLLSAPEEFHPHILEGMTVQLQRAKGIEATEAARLMLLMVFGQERAPESFEELSSRQVEVLRLVSECDQAWVFDGNMSQLLSSWGLPSRRDALKTYVNQKDD